MDLKKLKITYEELFKLQNWNEQGYNNTQYANIDMFVDTPSGLTNIQAGVVKPDLNMYNILFEDGTECNVADTHIFSYKGKEIFAKDAKYVDSKNGILKIKSKKYIGKHNGYDINIKSPHWYYSNNDVIYHNTLLMTDIISGQIKTGKNILLVSMEMQDKEMMKRIHANALDLNISRLTGFEKDNGYSPDEIRAAKEKVKTNGKLYVKDYPTGGFSPLMLDALLDNYKIEKGIEFDIVYLDYLGIMKSDLLTPAAGLYSYIKSIVEETRSIASKRKIPIVSASQLNRCLDLETIIQTDKSNIKLKDIKIGQKLQDNKSVEEILDTGKQQCYEIKTKSGKSLICSENHKIPTNKGTMTIKVGLKEGLKVHTK